MDINQITTAFSALSQENRLKVFRLLIQSGRTGAPAGALSEELGIPHNTLSFHLSHLKNSGLVSSLRQGRSIIYTANCELVEDIIGYLVKHCCSRESETNDCSPTCSLSTVELDGAETKGESP